MCLHCVYRYTQWQKKNKKQHNWNITYETYTHTGSDSRGESTYISYGHCGLDQGLVSWPTNINRHIYSAQIRISYCILCRPWKPPKINLHFELHTMPVYSRPRIESRSISRMDSSPFSFCCSSSSCPSSSSSCFLPLHEPFLLFVWNTLFGLLWLNIFCGSFV